MARDYTDTVRDLKLLIESELKPQRVDSSTMLKQVLKNVEEMATEIKEQREEIVNLRLKAEHTITRTEVAKMAAEATKVVTERVNNLWKFVTATQVAFGSLLSFMAAKVFGGH